MTAMLSRGKIRPTIKLSLIVVCLLGIMGCSDKLQTTVMSGSKSPTQTPMTKLEDQTAPVEQVGQPPVQEEASIQTPSLGIPAIDIPVEEPARPFIAPSEKEIFSASRTDEPESIGQKAQVGETETTQSSTPSASESQALSQKPGDIKGIPQISIDPEMPTLPTIRESAALEVSQERKDTISAQSSESSMKAGESVEPDQPPTPPVQIAKVVPPAAPEAIEVQKERIVRALEDVYFDYDRFTIRKDAIPALRENAQTLVADLADKNVVIEGHCDQRGTESYNMVLGKRRANAVKEYLVSLGVPRDNLQVVSYGKEKPFCTEQTEQCWQENRRGHFILK